MEKWAQAYREAGFSIIPLRPRSKIPAIKWEEYQKRIATKEEISQWFAKDPSLNIGLVTGEISGFVVVDLDGEAGLATGKRLRLTSPVCVHTANGSHLYYRWDKALMNSVKKLPGLDIRGDGGQVAAPPSLHPNGKFYRWLASPLARHLLPVFPASLLKLLSGSDAKVLSAGNEQGWIAKALGEMKHGNIDDTLFRVCSRLRADGYSDGDARLLLAPHATAAGATAGHLDDKIANVWSRYPANITAKPVESKSESLSEFLQDTQKVEWICEPIIAKKSIGFVAGLPETQKTWLLMDLAVELQRGGSWIGLMPTTPARVLFVDQERFKGETQRRFAAVVAGKGLQGVALPGLFIKSGTAIKINDDRAYAAFREELLSLRPDIVMVDSFGTFHTVPENNRMDMQVVLDRIKSLRDEIGCAFVFINHESKTAFEDSNNGIEANAFRMLGSVGIVAAAEFVLTVRRLPDNSSIVHHTKSTMASKRKSFFMRVVDTERGIAVKGVA